MLTRRRFLINSSVLGAATTSSVLAFSASEDANVGEQSGYRALVCISLAGGNDSFNMLVPTDAGEYKQYCAARGNLALGRDELHSLPTFEKRAAKFGVHPGLVEMQGLYANKELGFVANVGSLPAPYTPSMLASRKLQMPDNLFSHSEQLAKWQSCCDDAEPKSGWLGRMGDALTHRGVGSNATMNVSLSGVNALQHGAKAVPFRLEPKRRDLFSHAMSSNTPKPVSIDFDFINEQIAKGVIARSNVEQTERAAQKHEFIQSKINGLSADNEIELHADFSDDSFSQQLASVAQMIANRSALKAKRQIFYISMNGWDHHHDLLPNHAAMLQKLDQGLKSFSDALKGLGVFDDVTTFTTSEFARSMNSNGSGSDHGWGGHQIVMGGAIRGGTIHGRYPSLAASNPLNLDGAYVPTLANQQYFAEFAKWMGVSQQQMQYVLPNLNRFQSARKADNHLDLFGLV